MASDTATMWQEFSMLTDWIMPDGKSLGECTGDELKAWESAAHRDARDARRNAEVLQAVAAGSRNPLLLLKAKNIINRRKAERRKTKLELVDFAALRRQTSDVAETVHSLKPGDWVAVAVVLRDGQAGPHAERVWAEVRDVDDAGILRCRLSGPFHFIHTQCRPGKIVQVRPGHIVGVRSPLERLGQAAH